MFDIMKSSNISFDSSSITVEILDSIMGSGKTTNILKWIDANNSTEKFIYVSPLLSEVDEGGRVQRDLKHTRFHYPKADEANRTKGDSLLSMLQDGLNISCTHSLYLLMTDAHLNEIRKQNYIVIIDEELGVIDSYDSYSQYDIRSLIKSGSVVKQESDGMLLWVSDDDNYDEKDHAYNKLKRHIQSGILYSAKRADSMLVTQLPIKLFTVAKRVIIITYMFEGNILSTFLKLKGIEYKPFTDVTTTPVDKKEINNLITMYELKSKWKELGKLKLSNTWYTSNNNGNATAKDIKSIENFISSFCRISGCSYKELMYTFPKHRRFDNSKARGVIKPKGYIDREEELADGSIEIEKVWVATQTRATNDYDHKTHLVHAFNRYPNTAVKSYLQDYGQIVDDDIFALCELLQWVWRSAIRKGEPITLCIVSTRMRKLFDKWLNE